jgi:hypothetical protein
MQNANVTTAIIRNKVSRHLSKELITLTPLLLGKGR